MANNESILNNKFNEEISCNTQLNTEKNEKEKEKKKKKPTLAYYQPPASRIANRDKQEQNQNKMITCADSIEKSSKDNESSKEIKTAELNDTKQAVNMTSNQIINKRSYRIMRLNMNRNSITKSEVKPNETNDIQNRD